MNASAERRSIMDKLFTPLVSIEQFAAYLDGNLPESQMREIDLLIATNPGMEELAEMSDVIAEDIQAYLQDEFAYEADMTALEDGDFDIPNLDSDIAPHTGDDRSEYKDVACAADEIIDIDEIATLNNDDETVENIFENGEFQSLQNEDSINTFNEDNNNVQESLDFPLDDVFLSS